MFQRVRPYFGTFVSIDAQGQGALRAIDAAFAAIEEVGALHHPDTGIDVDRLHAARLGRRVRVHPWTHELLRLCRELNIASAGVFDPCTPGSRGRIGDLDLGSDGTVTKRADIALDLGGIAKGFAVDRAIETLHAHGCAAGAVNAGGDVRVFGSEPREIWLRSASGPAHALRLCNAAVAVSAPPSERSPSGHRGFYIGSTREQTAGRWVAVTAPAAALADGLTKCAMLCAPEAAAALLARYGARGLFEGSGSPAH